VYDFGNYSVGVSSAAQTYFQKNLKFSYRRISHISWDVQNSGLYNPRNPVGVKKQKCGTCSDGEKILLRKKKKETQSLPITLDFKLESHREGSATYFREYLRDYMKKMG
jgi:penicillin-binding protein 1A